MLNYIDNFIAIYNIFGNDFVFENSELLEFNMNLNTKVVFMRILTFQEVIKKPKKWDKWEVAYITISLYGVDNIKISGENINTKIESFSMEEKNSKKELNLQCGENTLKCCYEVARIDNVTPGLLGSE